MIRLAVWLLLAFGVTQASAGESAKVPTNLQLLGQVTQGAIDEALATAPLDGHPAVVLVGAEQNRGNWFLEEYLVEALQARGVTVRAGGIATPEMLPPDTPAPADTSGATQGNLNPSASDGLADSAGTPVALAAPSSSKLPILEYRILDLALRYAGGHRRLLLVGSRNVDREAFAVVRARLLDGSTHEILWVGSGEARADDRIGGGHLRQVEASAYPCDPPKLAPPGFAKLVEPAVVTAIVAGLVYLFYTNQN